MRDPIIEEEIKTRNCVRLVGSVMETDVVTPEIIRLCIVSHSSYEENNLAFIHVYFYGERAVQAITRSIYCMDEEYPRVEILGFIQTSKRRHSRETDYYQDIIGVEIAHAEKALESALGFRGIGRVKAENHNQFICFGKAVNIYCDYNAPRQTVWITLKTWHNHHANFPQLTGLSVNVCRNMRNIREDDYVAAIGEIGSRPLRGKGNPLKTNVFISDIQKIPRESLHSIGEGSLELESKRVIYRNTGGIIRTAPFEKGQVKPIPAV